MFGHNQNLTESAKIEPAAVTLPTIEKMDSVITDIFCPDCGMELIRLGACFTCPTCGFGSCG